jgi:hypothetical protein
LKICGVRPARVAGAESSVGPFTVVVVVSARSNPFEVAASEDQRSQSRLTLAACWRRNVRQLGHKAPGERFAIHQDSHAATR